MAQIATISLTVDSTSHSYAPSAQEGLRSVYIEEGTSYALSNKIVLTGSTVKSGKANRNVNLKIEFPFSSTDLAGNVSIKRAYANVSFVLPVETASTAVATLRGTLAALLANTIVSDMVDSGKNPY